MECMAASVAPLASLQPLLAFACKPLVNTAVALKDEGATQRKPLRMPLRVAAGRQARRQATTVPSPAPLNSVPPSAENSSAVRPVRCWASRCWKVARQSPASRPPSADVWNSCARGWAGTCSAAARHPRGHSPRGAAPPAGSPPHLDAAVAPQPRGSAGQQAAPGRQGQAGGPGGVDVAATQRAQAQPVLHRPRLRVRVWAASVNMCAAAPVWPALEQHAATLVAPPSIAVAVHPHGWCCRPPRCTAPVRRGRAPGP